MKGYVAGIDWINAEAMKYWSFTANTSEERKRGHKEYGFQW